MIGRLTSRTSVVGLTAQNPIVYRAVNPPVASLGVEPNQVPREEDDPVASGA